MGHLQKQYGLQMLGARPGVCQECATKHDPNEPHNAQSLHYQYRFFDQHGRWPTWADAMDHCSETVQTFWRIELRRRGVDPDSTKLTPSAGVKT